MSNLELRAVDPDSDALFDWAAVAALVFKDPAVLTRDRVEFRRPSYRQQRLSAAHDGAELVATCRSWDTGLTVPGGSIAADAISSVTVKPTHRRRGALTAMITSDLDRAARAGTAVAILIASEATIYGRFGFGPATQTATWTLDVRAARLRPQVPRGGRLEIVSPQRLRPYGPAVYEAARRGGAIDRDERWWDVALEVTPTPGREAKPAVAVLHRDGDGEVDGYLTYHYKSAWEDHEAATVVHVDHLEAVSAPAYAALWGYLAELDLVATIRAEDRAVDEPLPWLLMNSRAARPITRGDLLWTRVLDPVAALSSRRYESAGHAIIEIVDAAGYAARRVRLEADENGVVECRPTGAPAEVVLPIDTLSAVWLGGGDLRAAQVAGRAVEEVPGALARLATLLRTSTQPWMNTWF